MNYFQPKQPQKSSSIYRSYRVYSIRLPIVFLCFFYIKNKHKILDNSSPKRPNSKSSYSLREAHSPEEDIVSASHSGLLTRFNKDQRGSYLAVPTGITH